MQFNSYVRSSCQKFLTIAGKAPPKSGALAAGVMHKPMPYIIIFIIIPLAGCSIAPDNSDCPQQRAPGYYGGDGSSEDSPLEIENDFENRFTPRAWIVEHRPEAEDIGVLSGAATYRTSSGVTKNIYYVTTGPSIECVKLYTPHR